MPYQDLPSLTAVKFIGEVFSRSIENTNNLQVAETYIQLRSSFAAQAIDTGSSRNSGYYLIDESPVEPMGPGLSPVVQFTRTYAAVPASRSETVRVLFNYPGKSSGSGASWLRYGLRRPITLEVNATDAFQYFRITTGSGGPTPSAITVPTLSSEVVDYFGVGYDTSPPYSLIGTTSPASEPSSYVVSNAISRWKGNIWQMVTRTVPYPAAVI